MTPMLDARGERFHRQDEGGEGRRGGRGGAGDAGVAGGRAAAAAGTGSAGTGSAAGAAEAAAEAKPNATAAGRTGGWWIGSRGWGRGRGSVLTSRHACGFRRRSWFGRKPPLGASLGGRSAPPQETARARPRPCNGARRIGCGDGRRRRRGGTAAKGSERGFRRRHPPERRPSW